MSEIDEILEKVNYPEYWKKKFPNVFEQKIYHRSDVEYILGAWIEYVQECVKNGKDFWEA